MSKYVIDIDLELKSLNQEINQLEKRIEDVNKTTSKIKFKLNISQAEAELKRLKQHIADIQKMSVAPTKTIMSSWFNVPTGGMPSYFEQPKLNAAEIYRTTLESTTAATNKLAGASTALASKINAPITIMERGKAVLNSFASSATNAARNLKGMAQMPDLSRPFQRAGAAVSRLSSIMGNALNKLRAYDAGTRALGKTKQRAISVLTMWWQHFGRIAIGFTIAYRAMNAFEALVGKTTETIRESIKESGELASLQGKLAMFAVLAAQGQLEFSTAYKQAAFNVDALNQASIKSISSLRDLSTALDETAQHGVIVGKEMTEQFVSFADFTILIAQTTGDNARQMRSEINALMEGQMRANNILIRALKAFKILDDEKIRQLRAMVNRGEIFDKIIREIHEHWVKMRDELLRTNPTVAFSVWEKSIRRVLVISIQLASRSRGELNLFAETLARHTKAWNDMFSENIGANEQAKRFAVLMLELNKILDIALKAYTKIITGISMLATAFYNLNDQVKKALGWWIKFELAIIAFKGLKTLGGLILTLNSGLIALATPVTMVAFSFGLLYVTFTSIRIAIDSLKGHWEWFKDSVEWLRDSVVSALDPLDKFIKLLYKMNIYTFPFNPIAMLGKKGMFTKPINEWIGKTQEELQEGRQKIEGEIKALQAQINKIESLLPDVKSISSEAEALQYAALVGQLGAAKNRLKTAKNELNSIIVAISGDAPVLTSTPYKDFFDAFVSKVSSDLNFATNAFQTMIAPHMEKLKILWQRISRAFFPTLPDLEGEGLKSTNIKADLVAALDDLMKELGNINTRLYNQLETAASKGKVRLANTLLGPVLDELTAQEATLKDRIEKLREALIIATEISRLPEAGEKDRTAVLELRAALAAANWELDETLEKLKSFRELEAFARVSRASKDFKNDLEALKLSYIEGSEAYKEAAKALLDRYQTEVIGLTFVNEQAKAKLDDFVNDLQSLRETVKGFKEGLQRGLEEAASPSTFEAGKNIILGGIRQLEDAFVNFAQQGKFSFKDMVDSMIGDLMRLIVRMQIVAPLFNMINPFLSKTLPYGGWEPDFMAGGLPPVKRAKGGWLEEAVVGVGLKSGRSYTLAENGPEYVAPPNQIGGGKTEVHIHNAPAGTTVSESQDMRGNKRVDVWLDELIASKLSSPSQTSLALRRNYGITPVLAGR